MDAIVKQPSGEVDLIQVSEPACLEDEVKIEVKACGVCSTDLHIVAGSYPWEKGVTLGHEYSGQVVEIGPKVTKFQVGDKVAACMDGGFARYAVKREDGWLFKLPEQIEFEEAALLEPLAAAANSVFNRSSIKPGDIVLIEGPGTMGIFVLQCVKLMGATVIMSGTSRDEHRLKLAKSLGADYVVDVQKEDLQAVIADITSEVGVDLVFECTGAQVALSAGLMALKTTGQLTQVGIFGKEALIDLGRLVYHSQKIVGSIAYDKETWERCIKLLAQKKVDTKKLISNKMPLKDWKQAFEITREQSGMRVLLIP